MSETETNREQKKTPDVSIEAGKERLSAKYLRKNVVPFLNLATAIAMVIVALMSFHAMERNNRIIDTANLLSIYNAIEARMDAYLSITDELEAMQSLYKEQNIGDIRPLVLLERKQRSAIDSLMNTFEFACQQYYLDKVDKEAFKLFFNTDSVKTILSEFKGRRNDGTYSYIETILAEWH